MPKSARLLLQLSYVLLPAGGLILQTSGCSRPESVVAPLPPPEVLVTTPKQMDLPRFLEFTGRTEAIEAVELRARVAGYLTAVHFREGEDVEAGDILFEIDPRPYEAALKAAEAQLASAEAELKKAQTDVARDRRAFEKEAISAQQLDTSIALEGIAAAAVEAARAAIDRAKLDLEFTKVVSPVSGRAGRAMVTRGNLVSSGETSSPLTTIYSVSPIRVAFDVDERALLKIQRQMMQQRAEDASRKPETESQDDDRSESPREAGESLEESRIPVFVRLADEQDFVHEGRVEFADNRIDPDTGTIRVWARFANEDRLLHPGMFVRVRLPVSDVQTRLLIPERAIGTDQGRRFVIVVHEDNSTERRDVQPGPRHTDGLRIIDEGLKPTDRVITEGVQRVRPPAPVQPVDASSPSGDGEPES